MSTDMETLMREHLLALLRGGNAHMPFDEAVADFPLDRINDRAPNVSYSPWQLLEHIRITQEDILEFTRDPDWVSAVLAGRALACARRRSRPGALDRDDQRHPARPGSDAGAGRRPGQQPDR